MVEENTDDIVDVNAHSFLYTEKRICNRVCLFIKVSRFAFYTVGAVSCISRNSPIITHVPFIMYCAMLVGMFASICNWARYEYAFYKKYGTRFSSMHEFNAWKTQQTPTIKYLFDVVERVITGFFIAWVWPVQLNIHDDQDKISFCELSMTVVKIDIIVMFTIYLLALIFFVFIYISFRISNSIYTHVRIISDVRVVPPIETYCFIDEQTECCICLDKTAEVWTMTRCAHSFHRACLSNWAQTTATCPVCRTRLDLDLALIQV